MTGERHARPAPGSAALEGYFDALLGDGGGRAESGTGPAAAGEDLVVVRCGGVRVGLPQRHVDAVVAYPARIVRPKGACPGWLLGRMRHGDRWVTVADLAAMVLPEAHAARRGPPEGRLSHVLLVDGGGMAWGLAVEALGEPLWVGEEALHRLDPAGTPWLVAALPAHRLFVVDVPALLAHFGREAGMNAA